MLNGKLVTPFLIIVTEPVPEPSSKEKVAMEKPTVTTASYIKNVNFQ